MAGTAGTHFRGIGIENAGIVGLAVFGEEFTDFRIHVIAVVRAGLFSHADSAIRLQGTLKGFVGLKADNRFLIFVQIARTVGCDRGNDPGIHIQDAAGFLLLPGQLHHQIPQFPGIFSGWGQKFIAAIIGSVVFLNKISHIDLPLPASGAKVSPFLLHNFLHSVNAIQNRRDEKCHPLWLLRYSVV